MDSLRVDTGMLRQTGAYLRRVATEFAQAGSNSERVRRGQAHPGLAGAVRAFADTWDRRRQKMLTDLADLAAATTATADTFDYVDAELGRALLGQTPLGQSGVAASAAAPVEELRLTTVGQAGYRPVDWHPLAAADPRPAAHWSSAKALRTTAPSPRRSAPLPRACAASPPTPPCAATRSVRSALRWETSPRTSPGRSSDTRLPAMPYAGTRRAGSRAGRHHACITRARDAEDAMARAAARIQAAQSALVPPAIESPDLRAALALQTEGEELLRGAQRVFDQAVLAHGEAGARAEHQVNDGRSGDGLGDSRWDEFKGAAVDVLQLVSRAADMVAMGAGVLALVTMSCPPLSAFFASVATDATLVSLASKLLLQSLGEDMWTEIAWSVGDWPCWDWAGSRSVRCAPLSQAPRVRHDSRPGVRPRPHRRRAPLPGFRPIAARLPRSRPCSAHQSWSHGR